MNLQYKIRLFPRHLLYRIAKQITKDIREKGMTTVIGIETPLFYINNKKIKMMPM